MANATRKESGLGCLLIHGYGGSPFEMEKVAAALDEGGFAARLVRLPGHGDGYEAFASFGFFDWLAHAEAELNTLLAKHARVAVVGFSMGGCIALHLAARYPVSGAAVLSATVHPLTIFPWPLDNLRFYGRVAAGQIRRRMGLTQPHSVTENREGSRDIAPWQGYTGPLPLGHLVSMREGGAQTRALLPRLTTPLLIMQDAGDRVVNPDNAWFIARHVASPDTTVILTRIRETVTSRHTITTHRETADAVCENVLRFCREKTLDQPCKACE